MTYKDIEARERDFQISLALEKMSTDADRRILERGIFEGHDED